MYRKVSDFLTDWGYETESTLKIFKALKNDSLHAKPHADVRSMGFLAWHLTITIGEMLGKAGLVIDAPAEHSKAPDDINEIVAAYDKAAKSAAEVIGRKWTDDQMGDMMHMYGEDWAKGTILSILIKHQTHHRGQMTVLMRQAGIVVPGVYGPAKEEWAAWGMPAMD